MFLLESIRKLDQERRWNQIFQMMNLDARELTDEKTQKLARSARNRSLNRYRDVLPYDDTRVILETGHQDYINAATIKVSDVNRTYILTQGPLENTCEDFWRMVWENRTKGIIMLCRIVEKEMIKCHPYWPLGEDEIVEFGNFQIKNLSSQMEKHFIIRDLSLTCLKTGESRNVNQFHFMTWPDFGVPDHESSFVNFLNVLRSYDIFESSTPPIIHCSAGIGRSGTLILVDAALKIAEKNHSPDGLDVRKLLLEMRQQKAGLVQTPQQYRFANISILSGLQTMFPELFKIHQTTQGDDDNNVSADGEEPPALPAKKKYIIPPQKPPRSPTLQQQQQNDIESYNKLTEKDGFSSTDESGSDEVEYVNISDISVEYNETETSKTTNTEPTASEHVAAKEVHEKPLLTEDSTVESKRERNPSTSPPRKKRRKKREDCHHQTENER